MRPIYFLVGHPFGDQANEETIFEGPLSTREIADNALDAHLANGGQPARIVCLAEVVEPTMFACVAGFDLVGPSTLAAAKSVAKSRGSHATVFGLVPAKG